MSRDKVPALNGGSADSAPDLGRTLLGAGGLLVVLLAGALFMRLGLNWLPFAWDPLSPWPTAGEVVPARVVRAELAIFEDPLSRKSGRHRFQMFVVAAPTAGQPSEFLLVGPAHDADDLVAGPGQLAWFVAELAQLVGPIVPELRVSPALDRALMGEEVVDPANAATVERARIASAVAWFDEWPALRAFAPTAPLALRSDGERVAVEAHWQAERARRASFGTQAVGLLLIAAAMLAVFLAARKLFPLRVGRTRTVAALLIALSYPWWAAQLPQFARWLAPPGPTSALGVGVRAITEPALLTRGGVMPLRAANDTERVLVAALVPRSPTQLRGYTPLTAWLAGVAVEPRVLTGPSWEVFGAAQMALYEAAAATLPATDAATLAALDAALAQRNDAQDPGKPIAAFRAAVTAEMKRR